MMACDRDALICDFAETYNIYDLRGLPVNMLATLAFGLGKNSRIKMKMSGAKAPTETILLAAAIDRLSFLVWFNTEDGQKNRNRPKSMLDVMLGETTPRPQAFNSPDDFKAAWKKAAERG